MPSASRVFVTLSPRPPLTDQTKLFNSETQEIESVASGIFFRAVSDQAEPHRQVLRQSRPDLRPLAPDVCSGRVRLTSLLALSALLLALSALPFIARSHAASIRINSLSPWERAGVRVRSMSLSWLSEPAWMSPPADANSTDLRPLISDLWSSTIFASRSVRTSHAPRAMSAPSKDPISPLAAS